APRAAGRGHPRRMTAELPTVPAPAHRPTERTFHGDTVVDPFEWMREKTDPEVIAHLEEENAYADARTAHLDRLRAALVDEFVGRSEEHTSELQSRFDLVCRLLLEQNHRGMRQRGSHPA